MKLLIEIEGDDLNVIGAALSLRPFGEVAGTVQRLGQAVEQAQQRAQAGAGDARGLRAVPAVPDAAATS